MSARKREAGAPPAEKQPHAGPESSHAGEETAVRRELPRADRSSVTLKAAYFLTGGDIPQPGCFIKPAGESGMAVGRKASP